MTPAQEKQLQELIDRQEIWTLLLRYGRGLDRRDWDLIRDCYWDDAIDDHHAFVGTPDEFIRWAFEGYKQGYHVQHHGLNNHYLELDGDNAQSETYYTFIAHSRAEPHLFSIGRYIDHFQRRGGVWKIANRVTVIEKCYGLIDHPHDAMSRAGDLSYGPLPPATVDKNDVSYIKPVPVRQPHPDSPWSKPGEWG